MQEKFTKLFKGKKGFVAIFIILACSLYIIDFMRMNLISKEKIIPKQQLTSKNYQIDTPGCQIPYLDPLHPSLADMFENFPPLNCTTKLPAPVIANSNPKKPSVLLLKQIMKTHFSGCKCSYVPLERKDDDKTVEGKSRPILKPKVTIKSEFIKVECIHKNKTKVYQDFFPFIQKKPTVEKRCKKQNAMNKGKNKSIQLSILLLGIDSMSRNQYIRHMKKTDEYIKKYMSYVELLGYNKIGKNTFPNLVALTTGYKRSELPDVTREYVDVLPLIWNDFSRAGYRTLFSEDSPRISAFNYALSGFSQQPTDYYLRPFSLAVESSQVHKKSAMGCLNNRLEPDIILNWTADFFDVFPKDPLFALTFLSRISHDELNYLSRLDEPYLRLIQRLHDSGHLNRTVIFFFGDHGFRFGDIRTTYIGRMEDKLPSMIMLVPPWFPSKYPKQWNNLKINSKRLTSPLDIYDTLQGLLTFSEDIPDSPVIGRSRSIDLFQNVISKNRTCENSAIDFQYCACTRLQQVDPSEKHVVKASEKVVDKINEITSSQRNHCSEIRLEEVKQAKIELIHLGESDKENASTYYQVTIRVSPSEAQFEGTVWYLVEENKYTVQPGIDRVNFYGNQSSCINISLLKPYCYCLKS